MKPLRTLLAAAGAALALAPAPAATAAPPAWAPAGEATIHPGVQMYTEGAQCTANFVFYDATDIYIGYAAHCAQDSDEAVGNANFSCDAISHPLGTPVEIDGAASPGTLAYSSYAAMTVAGETDSDVCGYNDFAVVRIHPSDHGSVNPSMPFWGGPTGLRQSPMDAFEKVLSVGNSGLRGGVEELGPKEGYTLGENANSMSHEVWTVTPGVFGDSGSGYIDGSGSAFGIASTITPYGSNNASDLWFAMNYMHARSPLRLWLALGTEAFDGPLAGPGLSPSPPPEPQPDPNGGSSAGETPPPSGGGGTQPPPSGGGQQQPPAGSAATVSIRRPAKRRRKLRRLSGRATNAARVDLAVVVRYGRRCLALGPRGRFVRAANCDPQWRSTRGTSRWSVRLRGIKPPGRYLVMARAFDAQGRVATAHRTARVR